MTGEPLTRVALGQRLTVRHRLPDGRATDSVGTLTARDATSVTLRTRLGEVRVLLESVVVHRVVRPGPWRVATFLRRAGVAVLDLDGVVRDAVGDGALARAIAVLVDELVEAGVPVIVLTDGTDRGPEGLERVGLGHLAPWLLSTSEPGVATPAPEAYAAAHARIEDRLGRPVARGEVHFTDDRPSHVEAARAFGWQARILTPPA